MISKRKKASRLVRPVHAASVDTAIPVVKVYFSDFFEISEDSIEDYGTFNISLVADLPLFVDPFLLFNSKKSEYQRLHQGIIQYLTFLRDKSAQGSLDQGLLKAWYRFPEVRQNWFGFTVSGNSGSGLGTAFAEALHENLNRIFADLDFRAGLRQMRFLDHFRSPARKSK